MRCVMTLKAVRSGPQDSVSELGAFWWGFPKDLCAKRGEKTKLLVSR